MAVTRDEIAEQRRKKRKRYRRKRLFGLLVVLLCLLLVVVAIRSVTPTTFQDISNYFKTAFLFGNHYPGGLSTTMPVNSCELLRGYAVLTESELLMVGKNGDVLLEYTHGYATPAIVGGNNRVVVYNRNSREIVVCNQTEVLAKWNTDDKIISADMASNGMVVVLTRSDDFLSALHVYERGGYNKLLTWYSSSGFPLSVTISDNGKTAAVVSLNAGPSGVVSTITLIDVAHMTETQAFDVDGLVLRVMLDRNSLIAITDKNAAKYSLGGEQLKDYNFGDLPLLALEGDSNGMVLAFGDNNRSALNTIIYLNANLEMRFEAVSIGAIHDLYKTRDRVYVLGSGVVNTYNFQGENLKTYEIESRAFALYAKGGSIVIIYPDHIDKVN